MKHQNIFLILILLLIIVSGLSCSNTDSGNIPSMEDYRKGTNGLDFEFDGMIKEIPEYNVFQIPIAISNKGASDIMEAHVLVNMGEKADVQDSEKFTKIDDKEAISEKFEFEKRSPLNPEGETKYVFLSAKADTTGAEDSILNEIKATACFDYSSHAMVDVCMDTRKYASGRFGARACEVKDISLSGGQGGPLAVTNVKPDILYYDKEHVQPYFEITIENKGKGSSFIPILDVNPGIKSGCLGTLGDRSGKTFVSATLAEVDNPEKLDCDLSTDYKYKEVSFKDNTATLTCVGEPISVEKAPYLKPLDIYIHYGYVITKSANIKIKNIRAGNCYEDFPIGSKCNDLEGTKCDAEGFRKEPVPTKECEWGCCVFEKSK